MWRLEYIYEINKRGGGISFCGGWNFSKSVSVGSTFIREMRLGKMAYHTKQICEQCTIF